MICRTNAYNFQVYEIVFCTEFELFFYVINKEFNFVIKFLLGTLTYTLVYDDGVLYNIPTAYSGYILQRLARLIDF